jgi:hypothetical protein
MQFAVSAERAQRLCKSGKIRGVVRLGHDWQIPKDAKMPAEGRTRAAKQAKSEHNKGDCNG